MRFDRKYLVAVALLAVLAVVFGLAGTAAPVSELVSPQQSTSSSSDSVAHFQNPPTYDSGWVNITDKCGQCFNVTHDLNTTDALIDVVGRQSLTGGDHKLFFGATTYVQGWNQTYTGPGLQDIPSSVVQTDDGGYAIAGFTGGGAVPFDFWLIKVDSSGNMKWNKTYGGMKCDSALSVVQTDDGGYAIAGDTESFGDGGLDCWLVKTDSAGNMEWNRAYGGSEYDSAHCVIQTVDGGYAIAGVTESFGPGYKDFWLVKTDSSGNNIWDKTYGEATHDDSASSLIQTSEGGYAMAGWTFSGVSYDLRWIRTDNSGNVYWDRTYTWPDDDYGASVAQTKEGGFAVAGTTRSFGAGGSDFWLIRLDDGGYGYWHRTYGGSIDDQLCSVVQTDDGGYTIAGTTQSFGAGADDFWLVKTYSDGSVQWNKTYGGANYEFARSMIQTNDGGYAIVGSTTSFGTGNPLWLVKTDGELGSSKGLSTTDFTNSTIILYRGRADPYWNYVRVRIWTIEEPTWMFGDINQDGVVDVEDLYIVSRNYGKTFSALSLTGIIAIAGIHTYKKRKKQPE